ncbi:uncharacterized protein MEPE_03230 [Melanopsichium pennsylvanicum]|uniref:Uncharacterized protein n=2 Tax=Melanopsichium pennsylvanicum TaxID=63383 RepID=A0AAJ4XMI7_9BASI|nr:tpr-like protein [Melanopsichium pennsylvanicum 4]SNX84521.1 uncharacterized protein MEPE_03230 [Melanopsichium pennsylvanicum]
MTSSSCKSSITADDREHILVTGLQHKSRGNSCFKNGDMKSALASYHHAVLHLSGLESRGILDLVSGTSGKHEKPDNLCSDSKNEDESEPNGDRGNRQKLGEGLKQGESEKELSLVYSNMAACYLKLKKFDRAVECSEKALKSDSKNVKAKFRKAQALRQAGDMYKAKSFLETTIDGLKNDKSKQNTQAAIVEEFENELAMVVKTIETKEVMGRNKWKGFLGRNPKVFDVSKQG